MKRELRYRLGGALCHLFSHQYRYHRAENWKPNGFSTWDDGEWKVVPRCEVVKRCLLCGDERTETAAVPTAEMMDIPLEWEAPER